MDSQIAAHNVYYESVAINLENIYAPGDPRGHHRVIPIVLHEM